MDPQRPGPDVTPGIRASDAERDRVIGLLKEHHVVGRLSVDELSERSTTVYAARTRDELDMVMWDLPVMAAPAPASAPARSAARSPVMATKAAVTTLVLVLLTLLAAGALMLGFASAETDSVDVPLEAPRIPGPPEAPPVPDPPEAPQQPG